MVKNSARARARPVALNKELMLLAIKNDRKKEDLVEEAVRDLLQKYGVPLPQ